MSIEKDVMKALQKGVIAAVAASDIPTIPIKAVGRNFDVSTDSDEGKYLEIVIIPNDNSGIDYGDGKLLQGLMRLILHVPNNDDGAYDYVDEIMSIGSYFTKENILRNGDANVTITNPPTFTGLDDRTGPDLLYPVSMRYRNYNV